MENKERDVHGKLADNQGEEQLSPQEKVAILMVTLGEENAADELAELSFSANVKAMDTSPADAGVKGGADDVLHHAGTREAVSQFASEDGKIVIDFDHWLDRQGITLTD